MAHLENIRNKGRSANPFFCLMGIDVISEGGGEAVFAMQVRPDMHNGVSWLQGGVLAAIADEAMALPLFSVLPETAAIATISESTTFVRGIKEGTITAKGRVIKKGKRVAFTEGEVFSYNQKNAFISRTSAAFAIRLGE